MVVDEERKERRQVRLEIQDTYCNNFLLLQPQQHTPTDDPAKPTTQFHGIYIYIAWIPQKQVSYSMPCVYVVRLEYFSIRPTIKFILGCGACERACGGRQECRFPLPYRNQNKPVCARYCKILPENDLKKHGIDTREPREGAHASVNEQPPCHIISIALVNFWPMLQKCCATQQPT